MFEGVQNLLLEKKNGFAWMVAKATIFDAIWSQRHYIVKDGLELFNSHVSASQVLGLQMCAPTLGLCGAGD